MTEKKRIAVVGLGYVGLPLALLADEKGFEVTGIEVSPKKLRLLKDKKPIIDDVAANKRLKKTKMRFSDDYSAVSRVDIVIVCVPTPVDKDKQPDLSLVKSAALSAAKNMKDGSLLIIESTINPGVCDEVLMPLIEKKTKHTIGKSLYMAHCPERINPGDPKWHVGNINRVLGADSPAGLELAYNFYDSLIDAKVKKMGSIKEAEAVKIVENSFRDINIAFVNELAMSFAALDINVTNVIDGASTKPFGFMPFYPGIGVGGHCIPVDPYYLIEYARAKGFDHKFLSLARNINESMPVYAVDTLEQALISKSTKALKQSRVVVLGLSYKANVADDRESPSYVVIKALEERGAKVTTYDPHILDQSSAKSLGEALEGQDAAVLVTGHKEFKNMSVEKYTSLAVFLDGRSALSSDQRNRLIKAGVIYVNIGGQ